VVEEPVKEKQRYLVRRCFTHDCLSALAHTISRDSEQTCGKRTQP
jgi:hypothetical protein